MTDIHVIGIGIHKFGRHDGLSGLDQGVLAVRSALDDAGIDWTAVQAAFGGSSASGNADALLPRLGLTGIPFVNVANGCATGGSALLSGRAAIQSGEYDVVLAVGFDKHPRGSFNPDPAEWGLPSWYGETGMMLTTQFFAMKIQRYMALHGIDRATLGRVPEKAFANAVHAEHAWRRQEVDLDTILGSAMINDPLTKYMFCSPSEGAVALILASGAKARELGRAGYRLRGAALKTRVHGSFEVFAPSLEIERGPSATNLASAALFEQTGLGPEDIDVAQLQDTESGAEIMHMAENGFCKDGDQVRILADGETRLDGRLPVNTDGGCLACGEPIGASGLRQVYENMIQLRGQGGGRQVPDEPRLAYSQVYGAPGISATVIVEREH